MICKLALAVLMIVSSVSTAQVGAGGVAPPITLEAFTNIGDEKAPRSWEDYGDDLVVLEFWGTWCFPCVKAIPHLNELAEHVEDRGDVRFLSVTFERPDQVGAFLEVNEMRSAIGHDTDHSMVSAFGVESWPTTFLIRRGRVLARTHPTKLTEAVLDGVAGAKTAAEETEALGTIVGAASPRRVERGDADGMDPGLAEILRLNRSQLSLQVLRDGEDAERSVNTATKDGELLHVRIRGYSTREIVEKLWRLDAWAVEADPWAGEDSWSVTMKAPPAMQRDARRMIAASMGIRVTPRAVRTEGYAVSLDPDAGVLIERGGGMSSVSLFKDPERGLTLKAENQTLRSMLTEYKDILAKPVEVPDGLASMRFTGTITVPWGGDGAVRALEEGLGIRFEPAVLERDIYLVERLGEAG